MDTEPRRSAGTEQRSQWDMDVAARSRTWKLGSARDTDESITEGQEPTKKTTKKTHQLDSALRGLMDKASDFRALCPRFNLSGTSFVSLLVLWLPLRF